MALWLCIGGMATAKTPHAAPGKAPFLRRLSPYPLRRRTPAGRRIIVPSAPAAGACMALARLFLQKPLGIAGENLAQVGGRDVVLFERLDRRLDRAERRVGGEYHLVGAEEFVAAAQRMGAAAEHGGVGVEVVHVVEMRPLQRWQDFRIILVRGAGAEHLEPGSDAAVVIRDHAAEMVGD